MKLFSLVLLCGLAASSAWAEEKPVVEPPKAETAPKKEEEKPQVEEPKGIEPKVGEEKKKTDDAKDTEKTPKDKKEEVKKSATGKIEEVKLPVHYLNGSIVKVGFTKIGITVPSSGTNINYRASGATDIQFSYPVKKLPAFMLYGTYRYLPADVAPTIKENEYIGVVSHHLLGAMGIIEKNKYSFWFGSGLGLILTSLEVPKKMVSPTIKNAYGIAWMIDAGGDYNMTPNLAFGLKIGIGLLTARSWQIGLVTTLFL